MTRVQHFRLALVAVMMIGLLQACAPAQEPIDAEMIDAIRAEGLDRSQASDIFYTLTDVLGPRLSGSPAYDEAARWAVDRFGEWDLANPRLEAFEFGRGWSLEKLTVEMTAPRYMSLTGYAEAWSPATAGLLTGTPIYIGESTADEIQSRPRLPRKPEKYREREVCAACANAAAVS